MWHILRRNGIGRAEFGQSHKDLSAERLVPLDNDFVDKVGHGVILVKARPIDGEREFQPVLFFADAVISDADAPIDKLRIRLPVFSGFLFFAGGAVFREAAVGDECREEQVMASSMFSMSPRPSAYWREENQALWEYMPKSRVSRAIAAGAVKEMMRKKTTATPTMESNVTSIVLNTSFVISLAIKPSSRFPPSPDDVSLYHIPRKKASV